MYRCEVREKDHVQSVCNIFTITKLLNIKCILMLMQMVYPGFPCPSQSQLMFSSPFQEVYLSDPDVFSI